MTATKSALPVVASIVAALAVATVIVSALVVRYGGPSGTSLAVDACIDEASPASTFVPSESFSVDAALAGDRQGLESWPLIATKVEGAYSTDDEVESFWVVGVVDETSEAVCIVDFTDGALVTPPTFVDVSAFAQFR